MCLCVLLGRKQSVSTQSVVGVILEWWLASEVPNKDSGGFVQKCALVLTTPCPEHSEESRSLGRAILWTAVIRSDNQQRAQATDHQGNCPLGTR